jgi:hypothetical protein
MPHCIGVKQLEEFLGSERNVKVLHELNWKEADKFYRWHYLVKNLKICVEREVLYASEKKKAPSNTLARCFYNLVRTADSKGPTLKPVIAGTQGLFKHILTVLSEFAETCASFLVDYAAMLNHLLSTTEYSQQLKPSQFRDYFETLSNSLLSEHDDGSVASTMAHTLHLLLTNYSRDIYDELDGVVSFFNQWFANANEHQVCTVQTGHPSSLDPPPRPSSVHLDLCSLCSPSSHFF